MKRPSHPGRVALLGLPLLLGAGLWFAQPQASLAQTTSATPPAAEQGPSSWHQARLEARLETLKTDLGITEAQLPAWQAFTQAVLALRPEHGDRRQAGALGAFDGISQMAERAKQFAAAAAAVDQAAQALKAVLTPEQIARADMAWHLLHASGPFGHGPGPVLPPQ